jgi:DNA-binding transcriptional MerR regulator
VLRKLDLEPGLKVKDLDLEPWCKVYRGGVQISELAERVGVPTSTVRYYERIGLLGAPARTTSGYRVYDEASATRLLFVARARRLGLSCEQITELLPVWDGTNCSAAGERVGRLIEEKQAEIATRIADLQSFADQLDQARSVLDTSPAPHACRADLSCCVPSGPTELIPLESLNRQGRA